jgi:hypothetical protein
MSVRAVRLDEEAEKVLACIVHTTGLSISGALKQGLLVLHTQLAQQTSPTPYDIYAALDLGSGGYAIAPSTEARRAGSCQEEAGVVILDDTGTQARSSLLWGGHHCMN